MTCCDHRSEFRAEQAGRVQLATHSNDDFFNFVSAIPACVHHTLSDNFSGFLNLCFENTDVNEEMPLLQDDIQEREKLPTPEEQDRNRLSFAQRKVRVPRVKYNADAERKITEQSKTALPGSTNHQKLHLSAKETFNMHVEAKNACRSPVHFQRILDEVNKHGGSADIRAAQARFSVSPQCKIIAHQIGGSFVGFECNLIY